MSIITSNKKVFVDDDGNQSFRQIHDFVHFLKNIKKDLGGINMILK